jgi:hypothetical protein
MNQPTPQNDQTQNAHAAERAVAPQNNEQMDPGKRSFQDREADQDEVQRLAEERRSADPAEDLRPSPEIEPVADDVERGPGPN